MKKYFIIGGLVTFAVIFNLGYVFHEIIAGSFTSGRGLNHALSNNCRIEFIAGFFDCHRRIVEAARVTASAVEQGPPHIARRFCPPDRIPELQLLKH